LLVPTALIAQAEQNPTLPGFSSISAADAGLSAVGLSAVTAALQAQIAETEMLHAKLREQALNDPLTGLHNRRYLFEVAPGLLDLARRQAKPLCVVLIDLDHFKLLNDTYGHQAGD
jgi:predicted signal transduction protein with EAL and GGDEF domain